MVSSTDVDLRSLTVRDLLRLSARIVTELNDRRVLRSRNAPAGDLAEYLVSKAFDGQLARSSAKSWDVQAGARRLQVKCRMIEPGRRPSETFSGFRSWEFDACVFLVFDCFSYDVLLAVEIPMAAIKAFAREQGWVKAHRVNFRQISGQIEGARDVTDLIRRALDDLGE